MVDNLKIISYNIQGIQGKLGNYSDLPYHLHQDVLPLPSALEFEEPDILILQELKVHSQGLNQQTFPHHLFPNYNIFINNRTAIFTRTALAAHRTNLSRATGAHSTDYSSIWVTISRPGRQPLLVCAFYRPPQTSTNHIHKFTQEIADAHQISPNIIVGADLNAQHSLWGASFDSPTGDTFADAFIVANVNPLITPEPTRNDAYLDTFLVSNSLVSEVSRCIIDWDFQGHPDVTSDHKAISILLPNTPNRISTRLVWNTRNANWPAYQNTLNNMLQKWNPHHKTPQQQIHILTFCINHAALQHIGKTPMKPKGKRSWWNKDIGKLKENYKAAKQNLTRNNNHAARFHLLKAERKYKDAIEKAKNQLWSNVIQKLNSGGDAAFCSAYRKFLNPSKPQLPPITNHQRRPTTGNQAAEAFAHTFSQAAIKPETNHYTSRIVQESIEEICNDDTIQNFPATIHTVRRLISNLAPFKAFGHDDIHALFLKKGPPKLATVIHILKGCWEARTFSTSWKFEIITPIPKTQKPTTDPKKYRPVALLNILGKSTRKS